MIGEVEVVESPENKRLHAFAEDDTLAIPKEWLFLCTNDKTPSDVEWRRWAPNDLVIQLHNAVHYHNRCIENAQTLFYDNYKSTINDVQFHDRAINAKRLYWQIEFLGFKRGIIRDRNAGSNAKILRIELSASASNTKTRNVNDLQILGNQICRKARFFYPTQIHYTINESTHIHSVGDNVLLNGFTCMMQMPCLMRSYEDMQLRVEYIKTELFKSPYDFDDLVKHTNKKYLISKSIPRFLDTETGNNICSNIFDKIIAKFLTERSKYTASANIDDNGELIAEYADELKQLNTNVKGAARISLTTDQQKHKGVPLTFIRNQLKMIFYFELRKEIVSLFQYKLQDPDIGLFSTATTVLSTATNVFKTFVSGKPAPSTENKNLKALINEIILKIPILQNSIEYAMNHHNIKSISEKDPTETDTIIKIGHVLQCIEAELIRKLFETIPQIIIFCREFNRELFETLVDRDSGNRLSFPNDNPIKTHQINKQYTRKAASTYADRHLTQLSLFPVHGVYVDHSKFKILNLIVPTFIGVDSIDNFHVIEIALKEFTRIMDRKKTNAAPDVAADAKTDEERAAKREADAKAYRDEVREKDMKKLLLSLFKIYKESFDIIERSSETCDRVIVPFFGMYPTQNEIDLADRSDIMSLSIDNNAFRLALKYSWIMNLVQIKNIDKIYLTEPIKFDELKEKYSTTITPDVIRIINKINEQVLAFTDVKPEDLVVYPCDIYRTIHDGVSFYLPQKKKKGDVAPLDFTTEFLNAAWEVRYWCNPALNKQFFDNIRPLIPPIQSEFIFETTDQDEDLTYTKLDDPVPDNIIPPQLPTIEHFFIPQMSNELRKSLEIKVHALVSSEQDKNNLKWVLILSQAKYIEFEFKDHCIKLIEKLSDTDCPEILLQAKNEILSANKSTINNGRMCKLTDASEGALLTVLFNLKIDTDMYFKTLYLLNEYENYSKSTLLLETYEFYSNAIPIQLLDQHDDDIPDDNDLKLHLNTVLEFINQIFKREEPSVVCNVINIKDLKLVRGDDWNTAYKEAIETINTSECEISERDALRKELDKLNEEKTFIQKTWDIKNVVPIMCRLEAIHEMYDRVTSKSDKIDFADDATCIGIHQDIPNGAHKAQLLLDKIKKIRCLPEIEFLAYKAASRPIKRQIESRVYGAIYELKTSWFFLANGTAFNEYPPQRPFQRITKSTFEEEEKWKFKVYQQRILKSFGGLMKEPKWKSMLWNGLEMFGMINEKYERKLIDGSVGANKEFNREILERVLGITEWTRVSQFHPAIVLNIRDVTKLPDAFNFATLSPEDNELIKSLLNNTYLKAQNVKSSHINDIIIRPAEYKLNDAGDLVLQTLTTETSAKDVGVETININSMFLKIAHQIEQINDLASLTNAEHKLTSVYEKYSTPREELMNKLADKRIQIVSTTLNKYKNKTGDITVLAAECSNTALQTLVDLGAWAQTTFALHQTKFDVLCKEIQTLQSEYVTALQASANATVTETTRVLTEANAGFMQKQKVLESEKTQIMEQNKQLLTDEIAKNATAITQVNKEHEHKIQELEAAHTVSLTTKAETTKTQLQAEFDITIAAEAANYAAKLLKVVQDATRDTDAAIANLTTQLTSENDANKTKFESNADTRIAEATANADTRIAEATANAEQATIAATAAVTKLSELETQLTNEKSKSSTETISVNKSHAEIIAQRNATVVQIQTELKAAEEKLTRAENEFTTKEAELTKTNTETINKLKLTHATEIADAEAKAKAEAKADSTTTAAAIAEATAQATAAAILKLTNAQTSEKDVLIHAVSAAQADVVAAKAEQSALLQSAALAATAAAEAHSQNLSSLTTTTLATLKDATTAIETAKTEAAALIQAANDAQQERIAAAVERNQLIQDEKLNALQTQHDTFVAVVKQKEDDATKALEAEVERQRQASMALTIAIPDAFVSVIPAIKPIMMKIARGVKPETKLLDSVKKPLLDVLNTTIPHTLEYVKKSTNAVLSNRETQLNLLQEQYDKSHQYYAKLLTDACDPDAVIKLQEAHTIQLITLKDEHEMQSQINKLDFEYATTTGKTYTADNFQIIQGNNDVINAQIHELNADWLPQPRSKVLIGLIQTMVKIPTNEVNAYWTYCLLNTKNIV